MDLPFGLTLARSTSTPTTLFGGVPIAVVAKAAADIPALARVDAAGTARLAELVSVPASALGSTQGAAGVRPNPGVLPDAADESIASLLRFALPWGANIGYTPRSGFGTPFSMLRAIASSSPVIALCIQCRKDQMAALKWDFVPRDKKQKGPDVQRKLERARALFAKPDGVTPFATWIQMLVDEVLTIDAVSIFKSPTVGGALAALDAAERGVRYQLKPSEIVGYDLIDGTTIKVLLDGRGKVPVAPQIAYRQIIFGQPVTGGDCTADQLMYRPKTVRTWTPYGMSPIEAALLIVTADLNRTLFNLSYYSEGNIPEALAGVPDSWTAGQAAKWQQYWDILMRGDATNRSRLKFVPQAMAKAIHEFKKPDFTTAYDLWLLKIQCAMFGLTPSEIGFTDDVNKATSKTQGDVNTRRGIKPMGVYCKGIFDEMLAEQDLSDIETVYSGGEGDDALTQAKIIDMNLRNGRVSLDEVRADDGNDPIGAGCAVITATGPVFWEQAIAETELLMADPEALATSAAGPQPVNTGDGNDDANDDSAGGEKTPAKGKSQNDDTNAVKQALLSELRKWKRVAARAIDEREAQPMFKSAVIGPMLRRNIERMLGLAKTADDVKKIFELARGRVEKAQRFSKKQTQAEKTMATALTTTLGEMGAAFAKHAAKKIEQA